MWRICECQERCSLPRKTDTHMIPFRVKARPSETGHRAVWEAALSLPPSCPAPPGPGGGGMLSVEVPGKGFSSCSHAL